MKKEAKDVVLKRKFFDKKFFVLFGIYLVIGVVFFALLNSKTGSGFGALEISLIVMFAAFMTGFLRWTKSVTKKNAYMGAIIGLIVTGVLSYAFLLRYRGPYSTGFMIVVAILVLYYLGRNFLKFRKFDRYVEGEFDDR